MLLTRFSAQEKRKRVQSNGDREQELEKVLDKREKLLSHRITYKSNRQESQRETRGNTSFISGKAREGAQQSLSTWAGSSL